MDRRRNDEWKPRVKSGYTQSLPWPTSTNGVIVEPGDDEEPDYIDGWKELRRNARKELAVRSSRSKL